MPTADRSAGARRKHLARAQGVEEGLVLAVDVLTGLAEIMIERERAVAAGAKINHARRARIKAYEVAATRIRTHLKRHRRKVAKLEIGADEKSGADAIRTAVETLAL